MKKALRETQTLCAGYSVVRRTHNFRLATGSLPGGAGRPKFNQLEMVTTFSNIFRHHSSFKLFPVLQLTVVTPSPRSVIPPVLKME